MIDPRHSDVIGHIDRVMINGKVRSVADGIEFDWISPDGRSTTQKRMDNPADPDAKYLWPKGCRLPVGVPSGMQERVDDPNLPLVLVEGTKQHLHAAGVALRQHEKDKHVAVVGLSGCWGWRQDGAPIKDFFDIPITGRDCVVVFDADMSTNRSVHDAAERLGEFLTIEGGAKSVRFARLPGEKDGLDDILNRAIDELGTFQRILDAAKPNLPRKPPKPSPFMSRWFDQNGRFLANDCANQLLTDYDMAITSEQSIAVYSEGLYKNGESREFNSILLSELGNDYRDAHLRTITDIVLTRLKMSNRVIPSRPDKLLINVRNGLLDPRTLILHPHDPDFLVMWQFDIEWDPDAKCPIYEKWIEQVLPGRVLALEDAICPMLNPTATPVKAVFMYGPTRSGKSTEARLIKAMVGKEATSAVSLHQLSDNKFAPANLYGKRLNIAMDLSSKEVKDLSMFKMMLGDDLIHGDRKYGQQFAFDNQALIMFSANEIPAVSEVSGAYMARMSPFKFPNSFLGNEDPAIEAAMIRDELPGIFRRLVLALNAHLKRGGHLDQAHQDTEEFRLGSNKVALFLNERTVPSTTGTTRSKVYSTYRIWSEENGVGTLGKQRFFAALRTEGVAEFKPAGGSMMFGITLIDPEKVGGLLGSSAVSAVSPLSPLSTSGKPIKNLSDLQGGDRSKLPKLPNPAEILSFDLETGSVADLHRGVAGFIRIAKSSDLIDGPDHVVSAVNGGRPVAAHNLFGFDAIALGLDLPALADAGLLIDTKILAILDNPPLGRQKGEAAWKEYGAEVCAERYGFPGKVGSLDALVEKHGGYDQIPTDDPEYNDYCQGDAAIVANVLANVPLTPYAMREMQVMGRLAGPMTGTGFRVDLALLGRRIAEGEAKKRAQLDRLHKYGLPTTGKSPQLSKAGKAAIVKAFDDLGVAVPTTAKGGHSLSKDTLGELELEGEAHDLQQAVLALNGVRTVYQTIDDHLVGDRVHPTVAPVQASGRFSIWKPGLTVMGKRNGKHIERDVFLADEGCSLVAFDLNQIDARAVAVHSQDDAYMALFEPGMDSHAEVAEMLWGDRSRRDDAKAIAHGWNYMEGVPRLIKNTGLPEETVREFDAGMKERFPRLVEWRREVIQEGRSGGLLDNGFGRQMRVDPQFAYTQAPAYMGQSTARDLMCEGVLRLPLDVARMIRAFVHDEIVLSIPDEELEQVTKVVLDALTFRWAPPWAERDIEITAGASRAAKSWGQCYAKEEE